MTSESALTLHHDPAEELIQPILDGVHDYGIAEIGGHQPRKFAVLLRNTDGELIGGAVGQLILGTLYLGYLWVREADRSHGHGGRILQAMETEALAQGSSTIRLDTLNPRSLPFYTRHGYEICTRVQNYMAGFDKVFLRKVLSR